MENGFHIERGRITMLLTGHCFIFGAYIYFVSLWHNYIGRIEDAEFIQNWLLKANVIQESRHEFRNG
jgi:hypothetical protein